MKTLIWLALGRRIDAKAKPGYHASIRAAVERELYPAAT